jgi:hypothetical protein
MNGEMLLIGLLIFLIVFSAIETIQLVSLSNRVSGTTGLLTTQTSSSTASGVSTGVDNSGSGMVGGC